MNKENNSSGNETQVESRKPESKNKGQHNERCSEKNLTTEPRGRYNCNCRKKCAEKPYLIILTSDFY